MKPLRIFLSGLLATVILMAFIKPDDAAKKLAQKLWAFQREHPATLLHLHLDKTTYNTNEDIWFKAYILNPLADSSNVLYVRLTDMDKNVILTDEFPITDIRANGDILIPDTLKDGNYYLYAYTDRMISFNPHHVFVQRIAVTHNSTKKLYAEASVSDTTQLKRGHTVQINVKVKDGNNLLKNIKGEYQLITADGVNKTGKITTNQFGEAAFNFIYPSLPDDKSLNVKIDFKNNSDFASLILNLKHEGNPVKVNLYPEGGRFIAGTPVKTAVLATDVKLNPLPAKVVLKAGEKQIAHIQLDKHGRGVFNFTPLQNTNYSIETENNGNRSIIPFTGLIENKGYTLKMIKQNEGFIVMVKNIGATANVLLVLRSFEDILWSQPVSVASGDSVAVSVPVNSYPKQVLNVGAFDGDGNLLSERLFMNKAGQSYHVRIKTDKQIYAARNKVTVSVNITDDEGKPVRANLSIAASEKDRIDETDYRDIVNTWYLRFINGDGRFNTLAGLNEAATDDLLLSKNWTDYQWSKITGYQAKGKIRRFKNTDGVLGYLKPLVKKPGKLTELVVLSKSGFFTVPLTDDHYFYIPYANLIRDRSEKQYLIMNNNMLYNYQINIIDFAAQFDKSVTQSNALFIPQKFNTLASFQDVKQSFAKGVIQLKEVKITGNSSSASGNNDIAVYKSINCNDMVCMYNILNCRNHPGCCSVPVDGGVYNLNGKTIIYKGCAAQSVDGKTHIPLKCISIPKQFYLPDYEKTPSYETELHSTIYWNPNINTDAQGNISFSFFTPDIAGDFLINIQGVDASNLMPLSGMAKFTVR